MKRVTIFLVFITLLYGWTASAAVFVLASINGEEVNTAIGPPSQLRLFIAGNGFRLTWELSPQDPDKVTGYEIVRSEEFSGPYEKLAVVKEGVREYIDTWAAPDVVYFYKVRAMAGDEYSHFSNIAGGERPSGAP